MAKIENVSVSGLASSIFRSGYPMLEKAPTPEEFAREVDEIELDIIAGNYNNPHIKRAIKLASTRPGEGHDQFMSSIHVDFDLTFPLKGWSEIQRYNWITFTSSMSTMHRAAKFPIGEMCNKYVKQEEIDHCEMLQRKYSEETDPEAKKSLYLDLLYSLPTGLELEAGLSSNYRQLKTIYAQRRNHRLPDWQVFCDWITTLPLSILITGEIER